jgi:hypothetical protein
MTCKVDDYVGTQQISVQGVGAIAFKFLASKYSIYLAQLQTRYRKKKSNW